MLTRFARTLIANGVSPDTVIKALAEIGLSSVDFDDRKTEILKGDAPSPEETKAEAEEEP